MALFACFCIAEYQIACRHTLRSAGLLLLAVLLAEPLQAQDRLAASATESTATAPASAVVSAPHWLVVPRSRGRLHVNAGQDPRLFDCEHPRPLAAPGVRGETILRYQVNGSAEMTEYALVRASQR